MLMAMWWCHTRDALVDVFVFVCKGSESHQGKINFYDVFM